MIGTETDNLPVQSSVALEQQLLLNCAGTASDPEKVKRIAALAHECIDWEHLVGLAVQHRVLPLLFQNLNRICPDLVPKPILQRLKEFFSFNVRRTLLLTGELINLIGLLRDRGIEAIPFKGPILASYAYNSLALRQFDDIDILVPKKQILDACDLLEAKNYRLRNQVSPGKLKQHLRSDWAFTFDRVDHLVTVDLHWAFNGKGFSFAFEAEGMWKCLVPIAIAGKRVMALPLEETLLLHCVHGAKHEWERLEWISALGEMIQAHKTMEWGRLLARAQQLRGERMLLLGLKVVQDLLGTEIPAALGERIAKDSKLEGLVKQVRRGLFEPLSPELREAGRYAFHLLMRESWRDRVRYFSYFTHNKLIPNTQDNEDLRLPAALNFMHYFSRPFRLLREYRLGPFAEFLRRMGKQ